MDAIIRIAIGMGVLFFFIGLMLLVSWDRERQAAKLRPKDSVSDTEHPR